MTAAPCQLCVRYGADVVTIPMERWKDVFDIARNLVTRHTPSFTTKYPHAQVALEVDTPLGGMMCSDAAQLQLTCTVLDPSSSVVTCEAIGLVKREGAPGVRRVLREEVQSVDERLSVRLGSADGIFVGALTILPARPPSLSELEELIEDLLRGHEAHLGGPQSSMKLFFVVQGEGVQLPLPVEGAADMASLVHAVEQHGPAQVTLIAHVNTMEQHIPLANAEGRNAKPLDLPVAVQRTVPSMPASGDVSGKLPDGPGNSYVVIGYTLHPAEVFVLGDCGQRDLDHLSSSIVTSCNLQTLSAKEQVMGRGSGGALCFVKKAVARGSCPAYLLDLQRWHFDDIREMQLCQVILDSMEAKLYRYVPIDGILHYDHENLLTVQRLRMRRAINAASTMPTGAFTPVSSDSLGGRTTGAFLFIPRGLPV